MSKLLQILGCKQQLSVQELKDIKYKNCYFRNLSKLYCLEEDDTKLSLHYLIFPISFYHLWTLHFSLFLFHWFLRNFLSTAATTWLHIFGMETAVHMEYVDYKIHLNLIRQWFPQQHETYKFSRDLQMELHATLLHVVPFRRPFLFFSLLCTTTDNTFSNEYPVCSNVASCK